MRDASEFLIHLIKLFPNTDSVITETRTYATNNISLTDENLDRFEYQGEAIINTTASPVVSIPRSELRNDIDFNDKIAKSESATFDQNNLFTPEDQGPSYRKRISVSSIIKAPALIFSVDRSGGGNRVLTTKITPDKHIQLTDSNDNFQIFQLSAIVVFRGAHYTCYFCKQDNLWCLYNDLPDENRYVEIGNYETMITHDGARACKNGTLYFYIVSNISEDGINAANCLLDGNSLACL